MVNVDSTHRRAFNTRYNGCDSLLILNQTMKYLLSALMLFVALSSCSKSDRRVVELEETVKQQAAELNQLKAEQTSQDKDDALARELQLKRKVCTKVKVNEDTARIYFCGMMDTAFFLENPEPQARNDLHFFLEETGYSIASIEYFTPQGEMIYSITGTLSRAETIRYH